MNLYKKANLFGIISFFLFIIFVQLLWLFDPIHVKHMYWIDVIDYALYLFVFIPSIWLISSAHGIYRAWISRPPRQHRRFLVKVLFFIRMLIVACSTTCIYFMIFEPEQLFWIGAILAITCALILCDWIVGDRIETQGIPWRALTALGTTVVFGVVFLLPTSYTVTYPGLTMDMNKYAQVVDGVSKGEVMGVLIFERPAVPVDWIYAQLFPQYELKDRKETDLPLKEQLDRVRTLKLDADQVASAIAFQKAGLGQGFTSHGAVITGFLAGAPAADQLQVGDIIINLNGHAVSSVDDFQQLMLMTQPGMDIHLTIIRRAEEIVFMTKSYYNQEDETKPMLGAQLVDDIRFDIPRDVVYYSYLLHRGGPSHGAMLALTLINQLSPNGVTNGNKVAGTGTIRIDGTIGRIGGIKQKAYTVERAGADVFFVPTSQYAEAQKGAKNLNIVPVDTLADILTWLEENPKH